MLILRCRRAPGRRYSAASGDLNELPGFGSGGRIALSHPAVREAAVVASLDPRWGEPPLLVAVLRAGADVSRQNLLAHYVGRVARWCTPNDVVFVDSLPHTATGKLHKALIRNIYATDPEPPGQ